MDMDQDANGSAPHNAAAPGAPIFIDAAAAQQLQAQQQALLGQVALLLQVLGARNQEIATGQQQTMNLLAELQTKTAKIAQLAAELDEYKEKLKEAQNEVRRKRKATELRTAAADLHIAARQSCEERVAKEVAQEVLYIIAMAARGAPDDETEEEMLTAFYKQTVLRLVTALSQYETISPRARKAAVLTNIKESVSSAKGRAGFDGEERTAVWRGRVALRDFLQASVGDDNREGELNMFFDYMRAEVSMEEVLKFMPRNVIEHIEDQFIIRLNAHFASVAVGIRNTLCFSKAVWDDLNHFLFSSLDPETEMWFRKKFGGSGKQKLCFKSGTWVAAESLKVAESLGFEKSDDDLTATCDFEKCFLTQLGAAFCARNQLKGFPDVKVVEILLGYDGTPVGKKTKAKKGESIGKNATGLVARFANVEPHPQSPACVMQLAVANLNESLANCAKNIGASRVRYLRNLKKLKTAVKEYEVAIKMCCDLKAWHALNHTNGCVGECPCPLCEKSRGDFSQINMAAVAKTLARAKNLAHIAIGEKCHCCGVEITTQVRNDALLASVDPKKKAAHAREHKGQYPGHANLFDIDNVNQIIDLLHGKINNVDTMVKGAFKGVSEEQAEAIFEELVAIGVQFRLGSAKSEKTTYLQCIEKKTFNGPECARLLRDRKFVQLTELLFPTGKCNETAKADYLAMWEAFVKLDEAAHLFDDAKPWAPQAEAVRLLARAWSAAFLKALPGAEADLYFHLYVEHLHQQLERHGSLVKYENQATEYQHCVNRKVKKGMGSHKTFIADMMKRGLVAVKLRASGFRRKLSSRLRKKFDMNVKKEKKGKKADVVMADAAN